MINSDHVENAAGDNDDNEDDDNDNNDDNNDGDVDKIAHSE